MSVCQVLSPTEAELKSVEEMFGELFVHIISLNLMMISCVGHWDITTQVYTYILMLTPDLLYEYSGMIVVNYQESIEMHSSCFFFI